jgi:hypothetical protein
MTIVVFGLKRELADIEDDDECDSSENSDYDEVLTFNLVLFIF